MMGTLRRLLWASRRFGSQGSVAIIVAFTILPLMLAMAAAVDYNRMLVARARAQASLDEAVLRGVQDTGATSFQTAANTFAAAIAAPASTYSTQFSIGTDGSLQGQARLSVPSSLMTVAGLQTLTVSVKAAAALASSGNAVCILLLDPSAPQSMLLNSGARINAPTCEVDVATTANPAAIINGNTNLTAAKICLGGSSYIDNGGSHSAITPSCQTVSDPFAGNLPPPPSTVCTVYASSLNQNASSYALSPGVYCGGFNFNGAPRISFAPGVYVIQGGDWNVNGGTWTGAGVTFYFADTSKIQFNSGMNTTLAAPTSGTYSGILFYERAGLSKSQFVFDDTIQDNLTGLIYLPSRNVTFNSTSNLSSPAFTLVANTAIFNTVNWSLTAGSKAVNRSSSGGSSARLVL